MDYKVEKILSKEYQGNQKVECICEEDKCKCTQLADKIFKIIPCSEDDTADILALPDDWVPKKSGSTLANYLIEREKTQNGILEDMESQMCEINAAVDVKVREIAELLVAHIQQNQSNIDCIIKECESFGETFTFKQRNDALKEIQKLFNLRLEDIADFRKNALNLERERADGLRCLMRDQFQRLITLTHKAPKELLHDIDDRMYEVNQQLISNHRAYNEEEAELRAEADENVVKARSTLNQLCLGVVTAYRCQSARRSSAQSTPTRRSMSAVEKRSLTIEPLQKVIINVQDELDKCVTNLLETYRHAVVKMFSGFSGQLQHLQDAYTNFDVEQIVNHENNSSVLNLQEFTENIARRLSASFQSKISKRHELSDSTLHDIERIRKSLSSLGECLCDTYSILHDAGHLWDGHMLRSAMAQKLTIAAVEDLLTNNDFIEQSEELFFNQAMEQLCNSTDAGKLNAAYASLMAMLDKTATTYEQHSTAEIARLEDFLELPPSMAETLMAEFKSFLAHHPKVHVGPTKLDAAALQSPNNGEDDIMSALPRMIIQTELQEIALKNWRNGFLEAFKDNIVDVPDELQHQAQLWVNERSRALQMRNSLKQVSHSVRKERVTAAFKSRLADIRQHEARLESHTKAINEICSSIPKEISNFLSLDAPEVYPILDWVRRIKEDAHKTLSNPQMTTENKRLKMMSYPPRLKKYAQLFRESLEELFQEFKIKIAHRIQNARIANVRFMSNIKLFSNGGRYASDEAIKTCNALYRLSDLLESLQSKAMDGLRSRKHDLCSKADHLAQKATLDYWFY